MPIYEFKCGSCSSVLEKLCSSSTKESDLSCPSCGKYEMKRKFSTFGFRSGSSGSRGDDSPGDYSSAGGGGCSSCATHNCGSCH